MARFKHVLRTAATSIIVIVLGALIFQYFFSGSVPRAFFDARIQAAGAANNAAQLINNSLSNLAAIEKLEAGNSNEQALDLVSFEISQKQEKQTAALLLASQLQAMTESTVRISSNRARTMAIRAVTAGVTMVNRLIAYNESLDRLFQTIQYKILHGAAPAGTNFRSLIATINADAVAINELNAEFNELLTNLDSSYGK